MAQLSDTHLVADPGAQVWGRNPAENMQSVMHALPPRVDAMVITGDIAEDGTRAAYELALALTSGRADRSFFIAGNHDDPGVMDDVFGGRDDFRLIRLSDHWSIGLLNTQWIGHDAGCIPAPVLDSMREQLSDEATNVALCLHHPPISPCSQPDCGLLEADLLLDLLRGSTVRVVLSGHVHQQFETVRHDVLFLGAPSTFRQLRHGGVAHYEDTGEPPAAHLLELFDDGAVSCRVVSGG